MLRYAFFKEFNLGPKVLLWGDSQDMSNLSNLLRLASQQGGQFRFGELNSFHSADGCIITLVCGEHPNGMARISSSENEFRWAMDAEFAEECAEKIDVLGHSVAGHQYLEDFRGVGITVMVSTGEYPDDLAPTLE